jgi:hypothetical protein
MCTKLILQLLGEFMKEFLVAAIFAQVVNN